MADVNQLHTNITERFQDAILHAQVALNELTVDVKPEQLTTLCQILRDDPLFQFDLLLDVCGVDYLHYGLDDWQTESATESGFSRGVLCHPEPFVPQGELREGSPDGDPSSKKRSQDDNAGDDSVVRNHRFAVVYHLLSLKLNHRIRLRVNIPNEHELIVDSVMQIWPAANWYEREAFDLFGILFRGHTDLRRILTDYGFNGHPFRKDFPLIGKVEARYDAALKRVVYEPVSIEARILEPKVIRHDNRYLNEGGDAHGK